MDPYGDIDPDYDDQVPGPVLEAQVLGPQQDLGYIPDVEDGTQIKPDSENNEQNEIPMGGKTEAGVKFYEIPLQFEEIIDELSPNYVIPAKDVGTYPTKEQIVKKLTELHPEFSLMGSGFHFEHFEKGDYFCLLSTKYIKRLLNYLMENNESNVQSQINKYEDKDASDKNLNLAVDNSDLFDTKAGNTTKMKKILKVNNNFVLVSKVVYDQLISWFGGGPEICYKASGRKQSRKPQNDHDYKDVKVVVTSDLGHYRRFNFSVNATVREMRAKLCEVFQLNPDKVRIHDYFQKKPHIQLDMASSLDEYLSEKNLIEDNLILIELPLKDGSYFISKSNLGYFQMHNLERTDIVDGNKPEVKGACGLRNIGNTCYMNSTLQCLSNLKVLKDFFVSEAYKPDVNRDNPLGYKGKLAHAFCSVMQKLWQEDGNVVAPFGFKAVVSEIKPEFQGYEQHDSQELLSQVLDGLHEDLNRVKNKPYTEQIVANGRPDDVVAVEASSNHKLRNDSRINDLFSGLFKSTVTCPDETCNNISVTFDPYMILPLPLQVTEKHYQILHISFIPLDDKQDIQKFNLIAPKHGPAFILKRLIMKKVGIDDLNVQRIREFNESIRNGIIPFHNTLQEHEFYSEFTPENIGKRGIFLTKMKNSRFLKLFDDRDELSTISMSHTIVAFEVLNEEKFMDFTFLFDENFGRDLFTKRKLPNQDDYLSDSESEKSVSGQENQKEEASEKHAQGNYESDEDSYLKRHTPAKPSRQDNEGSTPSKQIRTQINAQETVNEQIAVVDYKQQKRAKKRQTFEKMLRQVDGTEFVGYKNCPFVKGDVWYGNYMFDDVDQLIRLEILHVEKWTVDQFAEYQNQMRKDAEIPIFPEEFEYSEDYLKDYDLYYVKGCIDSKEKLPQYLMFRVRTLTYSAFKIHGVYYAKKMQLLLDESETQKSEKLAEKKSSKAFWSKRPSKIMKKKQKKTATKTYAVKNKAEQSSNKNFHDDSEDLQEKAESLAIGAIEDDYVAGKIFFRPTTPAHLTKKRNEMVRANQGYGYGGRGYSSYNNEYYSDGTMMNQYGDEADAAREVFNTQLKIDNKHRIAWGKVLNMFGHKKGEVSCKRWESKQWNSTLLTLPDYTRYKLLVENIQAAETEEKTIDAELASKQEQSKNAKTSRIGKAITAFQSEKKMADNKLSGKSLKPNQTEGGLELFAKYVDPIPKNRDDRILVLLAHRINKEIGGHHMTRFAFLSSIPHMLMVPNGTTESEFYDVVKAKITVYMSKANAVYRQQKIPEQDLWSMDELMEKMTIIRANSKFDTKASLKDPLNVGKEIGPFHDGPLWVNPQEHFVWLVCDWDMDTVPFEAVRSSNMLANPENTEKPMNLYTALELFSRTEKLNAMNAWYCSKCQTHQEAFKQLQIWSLPPILVIQFKRFSQEEGRNLADKLEIPVDFPLEIDMKDYALNYLSLPVDNRDENMFKYDLVGVSSHVGGGLGEGHYVANCRNEINGEWYHFDDAIVRKITALKKDKETLQKIADPMAYVIFYVRRDLRPAHWQ